MFENPSYRWSHTVNPQGLQPSKWDEPRSTVRILWEFCGARNFHGNVQKLPTCAEMLWKPCGYTLTWWLATVSETLCETKLKPFYHQPSGSPCMMCSRKHGLLGSQKKGLSTIPQGSKHLLILYLGMVFGALTLRLRGSLGLGLSCLEHWGH